MQHLTIVTTGGTIDKIYFDDKSDYKIGAPQIGEILSQLGVAFQFDVIPILRKDSLHITQEDRALIRSTIEYTDGRVPVTGHIGYMRASGIVPPSTAARTNQKK